MQELQGILEECVQRLEDHYGDDLAGVVLYGSVARGEEEEESDIDLLVLLTSDFDRWQEIQAIGDVLFPVQMKCDRYISAKPFAEADFREGRLAFLRRAKTEGVTL